MPILADLRAEFAGLELLALDPAGASSVADAIHLLGSLTDSLDRLTKNRGWAFLDWTGSARA